MTTANDNTNDHLRMVEALLFAANEPLSVDEIVSRLPKGADVEAHIETIHKLYSSRGVHLVTRAGKWLFQTAPDLSFLLRKELKDQRKLSRAGVETLAIIAYHQPVTRAEVEELRGVSLSKGTLDVLMEAGWVKPKGRRRTPGRPGTYGITEDFLVHFGLESIEDLPGIEELKAAGLLDSVDSALSKMGRNLGAEGDEEGQDQLDIEDAIRDDEEAALDVRERLDKMEFTDELDGETEE